MRSFIVNLQHVFFIICIPTTFIYILFLKNEYPDNWEESCDEPCDKWENVIKILMTALMIFSFLVLVFFSIKEHAMWIPYMSKYMSNLFFVVMNVWLLYRYMPVIKKLLRNTHDEIFDKLELHAIFVCGVFLMTLDRYELPQNLIEFTININNPIISDWITLFVIVSTVTIHVFLIGALGLILLKTSFILLKIANGRKIINKIELIENKCKLIVDKPIKWEFLSVKLIKWISSQNRSMRIWWVALIIIIPIDLLFKYFFIAGIFIQTMCAIACCVIFGSINGTILFFKWIDNIPEKKIINMIFRSAFIVSIVMIVLINRYSPLLRMYKQTSGGLEFLASALIIPIIFSWIIEYNATIRKR